MHCTCICILYQKGYKLTEKYGIIIELPSLNRELSEVRREKTPSPVKRHERFETTMWRITLDNFIARNRGWRCGYGKSIGGLTLIKKNYALKMACER